MAQVPDGTEPATASETDEQQLRDLEVARCRAISEADDARLRELVDEQFTHAHANGNLQDLGKGIGAVGVVSYRVEQREFHASPFSR